MHKPGIFYFSSTGNSLYISKKVKEKLGGNIHYIPTYFGDGSEYDTILIVTPIYSFGLPVPTLNLLSKLNKISKIIVIQNYGGMVLNADALFLQYAKEKGLNIVSIYTMQMPENYTLVMAPPKFFKHAILKKANKRIEKICIAIERGKYRLPKGKSHHEKTYLKNKENWHLIAKSFSINDRCVRCLHCIEICPVKNITLTNGKITFEDHCIACLGCFHRCPNQAILYKDKDNKKRYLHPDIKEEEIGKDFLE